MNHKEHVLGEMELRPAHAREALQCLLHSILFLRAPSTARPKEVHCKHLRLSYAKLDRPSYHMGPPPPLPGDGSGLGTSEQGPQQHQAQAPPASVDEAVERAVQGCLRCLTPAGPDLHKGRVVLTLFERRKTQAFFGFVQGEEKVVFEEWVVPVLVDCTGATPVAATRSVAVDDGSWEGPELVEGEGEGSEDEEGEEEEEEEEAVGVEAVERRRAQERAEGLVRARLREAFQLANASVDHIPPSTYHFELSHQGQPGGSLRRGQGQNLASKIRNSPALIGHTMGP